MELLERLQPGDGVWQGVVQRFAPLSHSNHLVQLPHPLTVQAALRLLRCSELLLENSQST